MALAHRPGPRRCSGQRCVRLPRADHRRAHPEPADNADFLVFWGVVFAMYGVLIGVTTETTRAVSTAPTPTAHAFRCTMPIVPVAIGFGLVIVAVVGPSGLVWAPRGLRPALGPAAGRQRPRTRSVRVHVALAGVASGRGRGRATASWSQARPRAGLVLFVVVAGSWRRGGRVRVRQRRGVRLLAVATLASRRYRDLWTQRVDGDVHGLVRRLVAACTAAGVSALLLVGYPVLLKVTTPDDVFAGAAPIVLGRVPVPRPPARAARAPTRTSSWRKVARARRRALVPVLGRPGGLTAVGAFAAWPLGPLGAAHRQPATTTSTGPVFAGLVLGAGLVALLTVTGAAALALDHHAVYLAGWLAATRGHRRSRCCCPEASRRGWSPRCWSVRPSGVAVHLRLGHRRIG